MTDEIQEKLAGMAADNLPDPNTYASDEVKTEFEFNDDISIYLGIHLTNSEVPGKYRCRVHFEKAPILSDPKDGAIHQIGLSWKWVKISTTRIEAY